MFCQFSVTHKPGIVLYIYLYMGFSVPSCVDFSFVSASFTSAFLFFLIIKLSFIFELLESVCIFWVQTFANFDKNVLNHHYTSLSNIQTIKVVSEGLSKFFFKLYPNFIDHLSSLCTTLYNAKCKKKKKYPSYQFVFEIMS